MIERPPIEDIAARLAATTPEPWEPWFNRHGDPFVIEEGWAPNRPANDRVTSIRTVAEVSSGPQDYGRANATFLGHAKADVATLLAYIAALEHRHDAGLVTNVDRRIMNE